CTSHTFWGAGGSVFVAFASAGSTSCVVCATGSVVSPRAHPVSAVSAMMVVSAIRLYMVAPYQLPCGAGVSGFRAVIYLVRVNLDPTPRRRSYVGSGRPSVRAHSNGCCDHGSLFAGSFDCCFVPLFVFLVSLRHRRCSRAFGLLLAPPPTLRVGLRIRCGVLMIRRWLVRMRPCVVLRR